MSLSINPLNQGLKHIINLGKLQASKRLYPSIH